jgi:curved DNA-binding protein CbpA
VTYTVGMPKRDPHDVLGVARGADPGSVKAAWRRLAREHHPDLTGDDPGASRVATRRMAEINDAYEALRRADGERRAGITAAGGTPTGTGYDAEPPRRSGGPPRPRPTRPVTGRVDTSDTFRPRNATTGAGSRLSGHPPRRNERSPTEAPRASDPTGPLQRARIHRFRPPARPPLDEAYGHEMAFGKFRGHTLGEIAAFEPSYIDWLASTITRDRDLVSSARVIREELDRRGVVRRTRPERSQPERSA